MFQRRQARATTADAALFEPLEGRRLLAATGAPVVTGLVLFNADSGEPIRALQDNATIDYATLPTRNLSVRASTGGAVESVRFGLDGNANYGTENYAPYSIRGDDDATGRPLPWTPGLGTHTVVARAYSADHARGTASPAFDVTFRVTDSGDGPTAAEGDVPVVHFSDADADAREQGLDRGTWAISRTGGTAEPLTVRYAVTGTATNGVDYETLSGTLTIAAGRSTASLVVAPKDDALVEGTETVTITLLNQDGYTLGSPAAATAPILDNDTSATPPTSGAISDVTWTRNAPRSPVPRTEAGVVQVGSKIYVIGGFTREGGTGTFFPLTRRVHVYDMATRRWTERAALPSAAPGNHSGVASDGRYIYVVSGQVKPTYGAGTATSWRYDIAANRWQQWVSLPAIRFGGAAFIANGHLHFVGGAKADRETPASDHWAINLSNTSAGWQRKANMPVAQDHVSHATVNGRVYILGGEHGHAGLNDGDDATYVQHKFTFEYNPATNTWARKADMPIASSHMEGGTFVINGKIVLVGGVLTGGGDNTTNRGRVYDPARNTWTTLSTRYPRRVLGPTGGYWNGKIYMTDGYSPDSTDRQVGFEGTLRFA
jgi:N-acetylneuraminic acid mutarotase